MGKTTIEWTDASWNSIRARRKDNGKVGWHCEKVSPGCANCYSETFNGRQLPNGGTGLDYAQRSRPEVETFIDEEMLRAPLKWKKPRRVFVCSMTDLFGEWVTDEQIDRVLALMALAYWHQFQVLTKRARRMREYFSGDWFSRMVSQMGLGPTVNETLFDTVDQIRGYDKHWPWSKGVCGYFSNPPLPLPNVWLGVSVEDQQRADERIPHLLQCPAAIRFVSYEPALSEVDFRAIQTPGERDGLRFDSLARLNEDRYFESDTHLDWVIVGGESGHCARPFDVAWARSTIEQCREAGVACFIKQIGAQPVKANGNPSFGGGFDAIQLRDRKGGAIEEWPADLRVREFPEPSVAEKGAPPR